MSNLKQTALYPIYEKYGAKTIEFGGWEMPVQYSSIKAEHDAVRNQAGLFDVSNMGEISVKGTGAEPFLQKMTTNDVSQLVANKCQYTFFCNETGGTIDDLIIYKLTENDYLLVVNAANTTKDYEWLKKHQLESEADCVVMNISDGFAQLALQGPLAEEILQKMTDTDLSIIKPFAFEADVSLTAITDKAIISRSGYTGEDGFEIYLAPKNAIHLWELLLDTGESDGLIPCGLGARDTLRFEAGLPLYGQELSETISPIEAGLKFAVKIDKVADFIGKEALKAEIEAGSKRKIVGLEMIDKGIPRAGYDVLHEETIIGQITTGTQSPTLAKNIGRALIDINYSEIGSELDVKVRKRKLKAKIVPTPFYQREK